MIVVTTIVAVVDTSLGTLVVVAVSGTATDVVWRTRAVLVKVSGMEIASMTVTACLPLSAWTAAITAMIHPVPAVLMLAPVVAMSITALATSLVVDFHTSWGNVSDLLVQYCQLGINDQLYLAMCEFFWACWNNKVSLDLFRKRSLHEIGNKDRVLCPEAASEPE